MLQNCKITETPYHNLGITRKIDCGKCHYKAVIMNDGEYVNETITHDESPLHAPKLALRNKTLFWDYSLLIDTSVGDAKIIVSNMLEMLMFAEDIIEAYH